MSDNVSRMRFLELQCSLEAMVSERVAMQTANDERARRDLAQAYTEKSFSDLAVDMRNLGVEARALADRG